MNTHATHTKTKARAAKEEASQAMTEVTENVSEAVKERLEQARDIVEDVRDKAAEAFRERPYLAPLTAGAVGFGLGVLCGSRLARFVVVTAVGTVVSDLVGGEVKRLAGEFVKDMQHRLTEGEQGEQEAAAE